MMHYGAKIWGTRAYWLACWHGLLDMIRVKGCPHLFFMLSAADLQWPDLHWHMPDIGIEVAAGDDHAAWRKQQLALQQNPHITSSYLDERVKLFMKLVICYYFKVKEFWYRYKWQQHGSGHVHGFLWLKDAPDPDDIDWNLTKNHIELLPADQDAKMKEFTQYWHRHITATDPFLYQDKNIPLIGQHPCAMNQAEVQNTKELSQMLQWVQQHVECQEGYCLVKRRVPGHDTPVESCCFDYPLPCTATARIGVDSKQWVCFEPQHNDPQMNSYNPLLIMIWQANIDLKPVMSKDAAIK